MIHLWAPSSGETREFIQRVTLTVHYGDSLAVECTSVLHSFLQCIVGLNECTREHPLWFRTTLKMAVQTPMTCTYGYSHFRHFHLYNLYYRAVECLNLIGWRTFWGVQLFSGKRTVNVAPGTALHVYITSPNDLHYFKGPYSLKQQNNQNPQRHWPNK